jgi:carbohydrate-selective porin OprB
MWVLGLTLCPSPKIFQLGSKLSSNMVIRACGQDDLWTYVQKVFFVCLVFFFLFLSFSAISVTPKFTKRVNDTVADRDLMLNLSHRKFYNTKRSYWAEILKPVFTGKHSSNTKYYTKDDWMFVAGLKLPNYLGLHLAHIVAIFF